MALNIYPEEVHNVLKGDDIKFGDEIDEACNDIYEACKGLGTDEDKLNEVLGGKTAAERYMIIIRFKQMFDKELKSLMKSETSGQYGTLLELLCQPLDQAEAQILRDATKGAGTTESLIYPICCGRSKEEIELLKKAFFIVYDKDLVTTVDSDLSGDLKQFILTSLQELTEDYDPEVHTEEKAEEIAETFYNAGQGKWGTDEKTFFRTICTTPAELLSKVDHIYSRKYGNTLEKAVKKELGGKTEDACLHAVGMILNPYETIAELFESTMKGLGTDEDGLTACVIRYQHVLPNVKEAYEKKYGKSLRDRIHGETSGQYRDLMIRLISA